MYSLSQQFHRAVDEAGQTPIMALRLTNAFGVRFFSDRQLPQSFMGLTGSLRADGAALADGAKLAGEGSINLLDQGARVLSFGRLRETLTPQSDDFLASLSQEEPASLAVTLSNHQVGQSLPFSRLEAQENLLGATGELIVGLAGVTPREHLVRFRGQVIAYTLTADALTLSLRAA